MRQVFRLLKWLVFFSPGNKNRYCDDAKVIKQHDKFSYVRYLPLFLSYPIVPVFQRGHKLGTNVWDASSDSHMLECCCFPQANHNKTKSNECKCESGLILSGSLVPLCLPPSFHKSYVNISFNFPRASCTHRWNKNLVVSHNTVDGAVSTVA